MLTNPPLDLLLHPVALAVLGLVIGSFLNVVVHRLPLMMERDWWRDVAGQLADADSWRRTFGAKGEPPAAFRIDMEDDIVAATLMAHEGAVTRK